MNGKKDRMYSGKGRECVGEGRAVRDESLEERRTGCIVGRERCVEGRNWRCIV